MLKPRLRAAQCSGATQRCPRPRAREPDLEAIGACGYGDGPTEPDLRGCDPRGSATESPAAFGRPPVRLHPTLAKAAAEQSPGIPRAFALPSHSVRSVHPPGVRPALTPISMAQVPQSKPRSAQADPGTPAPSTASANSGDAAAEAHAEPAVSSHPHFDDQGLHRWETSFDAAQERARSEGKLLLIEMGREQCGQCRALVQSVLTRPEIAGQVQAGFVLLASDCDDPEEEVWDLAHKLEDAQMLPFVLFVDAQGQFIEGSSGVQDAGTLKRTLERLCPQLTTDEGSDSK